MQMDLGRLSPGKQIECPLIGATNQDVLVLCNWVTRPLKLRQSETSALIVIDRLRIRRVRYHGLGKIWEDVKNVKVLIRPPSPIGMIVFIRRGILLAAAAVTGVPRFLCEVGIYLIIFLAISSLSRP